MNGGEKFEPDPFKLLLRGGRHLALDRKMREKCRHLGLPHLARMPFTMKENEPANPMDVRVLGTVAVVQPSQGGAHLVEQAGARDRIGR